MPKYCSTFVTFGNKHNEALECRFCFCNPANRPLLTDRKDG